MMAMNWPGIRKSLTYHNGVIGSSLGWVEFPHALMAEVPNSWFWCSARGSCACVMYAIMSIFPGALGDDPPPPPGLNDDKLEKQRPHVRVAFNGILTERHT